MPCTNCFNGCADIISDKCVKYTGPDIVELNINNGDTLSTVEANIIAGLLTLLGGGTIIPNITVEGTCTFVTDLLPTDHVPNLNEVLQALVISICSLKGYSDVTTTALTTLNANYNLSCLAPSTINGNTHSVLQGAIDKLCATAQALGVLDLDVHTNYVPISQINDYIADYIQNNGLTALISNRMIPFAVVEYHGSLSYFDVTGAGIGNWDKVYLCNGNNGTPDKRGRVAVGVTTGMGGGVFNPTVDPALPGNPSYSLGGFAGTNTVVLSELQIPSHNHTITIIDPGHTHDVTVAGGADGATTGAESKSRADGTVLYTTTVAATGVTATASATGGGQAHPNVQPGMGCYYIMYIP